MHEPDLSSEDLLRLPSTRLGQADFRPSPIHAVALAADQARALEAVEGWSHACPGLE